jgi:hypothetical protein
VDVAVEMVGMPQLQQLRALKFSIQSSSAKFPYRIRMVCGRLEVRMLNLKIIGRYFDDELVINAGCGHMCRMRSGQG